MADRRSPFSQRDIERAIRAAERAGLAVVRVRIGVGFFEVVTSRPSATAEQEINEWDRVGASA